MRSIQKQSNKMKVDWNNRHIIWIRTGKVGSTSFHYAFSNGKTGNDLKNNGYITTKPEYGKIIEVHSDEVGYAMGVKSFRKKYGDVWKNAFKVMIVRNPYDRFVSAWKFLNKTKIIKITKPIIMMSELTLYTI
jgi:hypothetical protein